MACSCWSFLRSGMKKPGPDLGKWVAQLTRYELGHPGATKEEAQAWLAQQAAAGPPPA